MHKRKQCANANSVRTRTVREREHIAVHAGPTFRLVPAALPLASAQPALSLASAQPALSLASFPQPCFSTQLRQPSLSPRSRSPPSRPSPPRSLTPYLMVSAVSWRGGSYSGSRPTISQSHSSSGTSPELLRPTPGRIQKKRRARSAPQKKQIRNKTHRLFRPFLHVLFNAPRAR